MRNIAWVVLIIFCISCFAGCARASRIANDIDWVIFDGEPARDN